MAHVQPFRHLDQTWNHLGGKQRAVFQLITQFHNDKMVRRSTHKRYTGLILWSHANNLGKSSCMNTFCDIGRVYRHIHTDMKWQDTFDTGTEQIFCDILPFSLSLVPSYHIFTPLEYVHVTDSHFWDLRIELSESITFCT